MKKRLKSLLALCMAGIMMFAMTTGIASADETQTTSKIYMYDDIDSDKAYYPGDIIRPSMAQDFPSDSGKYGTDFFVVKYDKADLLKNTSYWKTLETHVFTPQYMSSDNLEGVYRYWAEGNNYAVLCDYDTTQKTWSVVEDEELKNKMNIVMKDYRFNEYILDDGNSYFDGSYLDEGWLSNHPYYSFGYGSAENNKLEYGSRALKLPSVDELFSEYDEYGYHYSLQKINKDSWAPGNISGKDLSYDGLPSGITPVDSTVDSTEEVKLIDIIFGKKKQTEKTQTKQGGEPLSEYSYITIKDALLIEPVANKYTVNFYANDGSGDMGLTAVKGNPNTTGELTYDKNSKLPENKFTREGYNFNGWKIEQCTYQEFNGSGASITIDTSNEPYKTLYTDEDHYIPTRNNETVTLQAQWVKDGEYTVNYDTNGGSAVQGKTNVSWNDKNLNDVTPTKTGYTFKGWKCGDTEVTADTTYGELAKDYTVETVTLTAQWEKAAAPATGDDTNTTLPIALLILSIIGIAGAGLYRRNHVK